MKNISPAVQMALRVSIGVSLAVGLFAKIPHSYWATITVFLVMCPSWGATIQKGLMRLGMTILGCSLGGVIYIGVQHSRPGIFLCFAASLFLMIYVLKASYNWCMFYAGFFIVFLYGVTAEWTYSLFIHRVLATAAGCLIAVIVSRFVFPSSSTRKFSDGLEEVFQKLKSVTDNIVTGFINLNKTHENIFFFNNPEVALLYDDVDRLKGNHILASYESILKKRSGVLSKKFITILDVFMRNQGHLFRLSQEMKESNYSYIFHEIILELSGRIDRKFDYIIAHLKGDEVTLAQECAVDTKKLSELYIAAKKEGATEDDLLGVTAAMYYLRKMNENLKLIIETEYLRIS